MKPWVQDGKPLIDAEGKPILCDECPCGQVTDCGTMEQQTFARLEVPAIGVDEVFAMDWSPDQWDGTTLVTNECDTPVAVTVLCDAPSGRWKLTIEDRVTTNYQPDSETATEIAWTITFHEATCSGPAGGGDFAGTLTIRKDGTDPWS